MIEIQNTVAFAYPIGSPKPTFGEMASFLKTLDSNPGDMTAMYTISEDKAVYIKYRTEENMRYALTHNSELLTFRYDNGKAVEVKMSVAGNNTEYVRIFDLPPEVSDSDLMLVVGKYGKIKRIIREKFPAEFGLDLFTGVRGIYMDVEKEIPSSLMIRNRKAKVFYSGNKDKCFLCKAEGHRMASCPNRKGQKKQPPSDMRGNQENLFCSNDCMGALRKLYPLLYPLPNTK